MEEWKDIVGYEGYYQVSNIGRIRSVDRMVRHRFGGLRKWRGKILRPYVMNQYGHLGVELSKGGVQQDALVHRLVAAAWIGPCPIGLEVRHGANGKLDNSVTNLSYGTHATNQLDMRRDGTHSGRPVKRSDGTEFINMRIAAEETGCNAGGICEVCRGQRGRKTAGGYSWEYI